MIRNLLNTLKKDINDKIQNYFKEQFKINELDYIYIEVQIEEKFSNIVIELTTKKKHLDYDYDSICSLFETNLLDTDFDTFTENSFKTILNLSIESEVK